jgi:hypothetical protein
MFVEPDSTVIPGAIVEGTGTTFVSRVNRDERSPSGETTVLVVED